MTWRKTENSPKFSEMEFITKSAEETIQLSQKIGALLKPGDVLAMKGDLAAGKTTFTKGIAKSLGVEDEITSPTFCLVSEYRGKKMDLYHMDVYRLDGAEDFKNLGVDDLIYGNGISVIEWSEKIEKVLPKKSIIVEISSQSDGSRKIKIENWHNGEIPWK